MLTTGNILQERYQLQRLLGRTAAGRQTWLSTDLQTQEQVTVKLLAFSPQMETEDYFDGSPRKAETHSFAVNLITDG